ncbi:glycosyltransferase family 4 protein [Rivularia sp. UHCC 0363]|uniref:glycosyltransferase family 4 protein n=1 Tax=Rivularia sp. UHCC 0363 TaxID=3110244 RepID=UPI002B209581|nr:glycosyltransferase family 4 protein [Rivularia sp. UHCC 0363]MEA5595391.1 glycosyltransferase family 4 protein [Rivularia sp. UHCC 0363]
MISTIDNNSQNSLRVVLVAENVSRRMGGESGKNLYYFYLFQERGIDLQIVCHARVREELRQEFPHDQDFNKFHFIEDNWLQKSIWRVGKLFHYRIEDLIFLQMVHWITQIQARKVVKKLIKSQDIHIVFQPSPITPKGLNFMYNLGVPVVLGPLAGGVDFPPDFRYMDSKFAVVSVTLGRLLSNILHRFVPGKLKAETLIVANDLTKKSLPTGCKGKVYEVIECGVDLDIWQPRKQPETNPEKPVRFVYLGRFVDWKGIQFLVDAFKQVADETNAVLELVGDGELREDLETQVADLGLENNVKFRGWMKREQASKLLCECDVFVMPSLREAGGNAVLEAMALGLPVIATKWAGPANTLHPDCGIWVEPTSIEAFVNGFALSMIKLANSPELRRQMGEAGPKRVRTNYFDWDSKVDRIIEIFDETLSRQPEAQKTCQPRKLTSQTYT